MRKVKFTVYGEPQGKGRPRFGAKYSPAAGRAFVNVRTPEKTVAYENLVKLEYGIQTKDFRFGDDKQLDMRILAFYSIPKSASKKKKAAMIEGRIRPTKKPDMDNVVKIIHADRGLPVQEVLFRGTEGGSSDTGGWKWVKEYCCSSCS